MLGFSPDEWTAIFLSLRVATVATIFAVPFAVVAAYAHLTGHSIPTSIGTGFTVITKDNYSDPKVAQFIYSN